MSLRFFVIFCTFLAVSGLSSSISLENHVLFHGLRQSHNNWNFSSWKGQHFLELLQQNRNHPNFLKIFYKYPRYHIEEFPYSKFQGKNLPSSSFKLDTDEKNTVSTETLTSIIPNVSSSGLGLNFKSSSSFEAANPVSSKNSKNIFVYADSNTKIPGQDQTHFSPKDNIPSSRSTQDPILHLTANRESLSTKEAEDPNLIINTIDESNSFPSDSTLNSEIERDDQAKHTQPTLVSGINSSLFQSIVLSTNDSRYSISNAPNLNSDDISKHDISSTNSEQLSEEDTQLIDFENIPSTFTGSSTQNTLHQSNRITDKTDETSSVMTSGDEDTKLTNTLNPFISETVFLTTKSTILSTKGSSSSVRYMTSSSKKNISTVESYSSDEPELHDSRERLLIAEPETVIEISSIRTAKVVVSVVFLAIALVATAVLTVYMIKIKRRDVQYDQLTLIS